MPDIPGAEARIAQAAQIADAAMSAPPPASQPGAPESGTSAAGDVTPPPAAPAAQDQPGFDAPFNIADVPEGVREHVERYNKQLQGAYTQKTQGLAEQLRAIEAYQAQVELLRRAEGNDPKDRIAALNELLDPYGIEIPDDEELEEEGTSAQTPAETQAQVQAQLPPELQQTLEYLLERERSREANEATTREQDFRKSVTDTVNGALGEFSKRAGYESLEQLPDHIRSGIIDRAIALPTLPDGMPDMATAITAYEAWEAAVVQAHVNRVGGKVPPVVDLSGTSGRAQVDLSDKKQRLAAAEAVAGRHL